MTRKSAAYCIILQMYDLAVRREVMDKHVTNRGGQGARAGHFQYSSLSSNSTLELRTLLLNRLQLLYGNLAHWSCYQNHLVTSA